MKMKNLLALSATALLTSTLCAHAADQTTHSSSTTTKSSAAATTNGTARTSAPNGKPAAASQSHNYREIDTQDLRNLMRSNTTMVILDARSKEYDDGKRIPGAKLLPPDAKEDAIRAAIPNKNTIVIVYCSNVECPASSKLAERLLALGYINVLKYPEGIEGWERHGNDTEEDRSAMQQNNNAVKPSSPVSGRSNSK